MIEANSAWLGALIAVAVVLAVLVGVGIWLAVLGLQAVARVQGVQLVRRDGRLEVTTSVVATGRLGTVAEELELAQVVDAAERGKRPLLKPAGPNGAARTAEQPS